MDNPRKYGNRPYTVALVHGGPGAAGEMEPVARELAAGVGVLEPMQTETSIQGQVEELKAIIERSGDLPVTLVGFSWGAWLSCILAASYPALVRKLILVSSAPFEQKYVASIMETRLSRLSQGEKVELESLFETIGSATLDGGDLERLEELVSKADSFELLPEKAGRIHLNLKLYQAIWSEAEALRNSGRLLEIASQIECPTLAIHGDYDPHPAEGVNRPLSSAIKDFRFVLLHDCGHYPWKESRARSDFYRLLKAETRPL